MVDGGKRRIILGVLVAPGEVMENQPCSTRPGTFAFVFILAAQVTGDTTYGTIENIAGLEREGIRAYVPLPDWEHQRDYYGPQQFTYDPEREVYVCPQGQLLRLYHVEYTAEKVEYRADPATCNACPVKAQCTPATMAGPCIATLLSPTAIESAPTTKGSPTRRRCASERCG